MEVTKIQGSTGLLNFWTSRRKIEKKVNKKIKRLKSKYDSIQYVGFSIGTQIRKDDYRGLDNDTQDWKSRIEYMKQAIESAYKMKSVSKNDSRCLKIFMAPEFFFRGKNGGYEIRDSHKIKEALRDIAKDRKYKDWLFVFGTIVSWRKQNGKTMTYNYALVEKGGGNNTTILVKKKHKSSIDYVKNKKRILNDKNAEYDIAKANFESEEKMSDYDSNKAVFEKDGIRFGVEICLDNIKGRIDQSKLKAPIDVLLVPSSGVEKTRISKHLQSNGTAFNVDGAGDGRTELRTKKSATVYPIDSKAFNPTNTNLFYKLFYNKGYIKVYTPKALIKQPELSRSLL